MPEPNPDDTGPFQQNLIDEDLEALDEGALRSRLREVQRQLEAAHSQESELQRRLKDVLSASQRQLGEIARVHSRFLPNRFPILGGLGFAANCRPCADVGGDFYDVFELRDGRVAFCMADVSGHGAMAAISMATTRALLRTALIEAEPVDQPSDVLARLSYWFGPQLDDEQFVTMWLGIYDPPTCLLSYASAAHPSAILWRKEKDDPEYIPVEPTVPLGISGIVPPPAEDGMLKLKPGDRVLLYTDGWTETPSRTGEVLDGERFLEFFANTQGQMLAHVPLMMFMDFERHAVGTRIRDDLSLLVMDRVQ
ncbi:MAG: PP2C family protein-serine/threonine phosphatase [Sumerlaeia bacterium]